MSRYEGEERRRCDPNECPSHDLTLAVVQELKEAVQKLMEGQEETKRSIVRLAEGFKTVERLERKIEHLEEIHRADVKEHQKNLAEVRAFMYKVSGVLAVVAVLVPFLPKILGALIVL
jgi:biopolymer transport protein ExbB/TolQ